MALTLSLGASVTPAVASEPDAAPRCKTPAAPDGHEPPCNPYLGSTVWSTNHRGSYAQKSSPFPAPVPGQPLAYEHTDLTGQIPVIVQISKRYADGGRALWFSTVGAPEYRVVYKVDYETLEVVDSIDIDAEPDPPSPNLLPSTSGVYNVLLRGNRLVTLREHGFAIYGDQQAGVSTSPIHLLHTFPLPERAFCRPTDRVIGVQLLYSGELAFVTVQGMLGVVGATPRRMNEEHLVVRSINGARCAEPSIPDDGLEGVNNSLSADERGGIYPVSTEAQYKFRWRGHTLRRVWQAPYETGGGLSGSTLSAGSGSTPALMGTAPGDDKFVVITDGQQVMHVTLFWRNRIPRDWERIAPGKPRRIACEFPVTFGDPSTTSSKSEQSVLVRGYAAVVPNNALGLDSFFALLPPGVRPLAALTGNLPGNTPYGMERIDWNPREQRCESVWANREVSIPNAIPTMSISSGLAYGIGVRAGVWGLEGLDFDTGEQVLWAPASPLPSDNSFFSATTIGPDGSIINGTVNGITAFRPGG